jgi:AcrR family transcriptional regulator
MGASHPKTSEARRRIVETADRLFYAEGLRAVGIDRIIAEAGVAKMSLYNHFPSKDDLVLAVLRYREERFGLQFQSWMLGHVAGGMNRLEAFFAALRNWLESPEFRGCMFVNSRAELPDGQHPGAVFSAEHKTRFLELLREIISETYGPRAAKATTPAIGLLVEGAIVTAVMQQSPKPADVAQHAAATLLAAVP